MYEKLIKSLQICEGACNKECIQYNSVQIDGDTCQNRLCAMAADAIKELSNAGSIYGKAWTLGYDAGRKENKPRWIPVTERLPEDGHWVLVWGHHQKIPTMMFRESGAWIDDQFEFHTTVTHWMPLPTPPKMKGAE